jgi:hypothetical protein
VKSRDKQKLTEILKVLRENRKLQSELREARLLQQTQTSQLHDLARQLTEYRAAGIPMEEVETTKMKEYEAKAQAAQAEYDVNNAAATEWMQKQNELIADLVLEVDAGKEELQETVAAMKLELRDAKDKLAAEKQSVTDIHLELKKERDRVQKLCEDGVAAVKIQVSLCPSVTHANHQQSETNNEVVRLRRLSHDKDRQQAGATPSSNNQAFSPASPYVDEDFPMDGNDSAWVNSPTGQNTHPRSSRSTSKSRRRQTIPCDPILPTLHTLPEGSIDESAEPSSPPADTNGWEARKKRVKTLGKATSAGIVIDEIVDMIDEIHLDKTREDGEGSDGDDESSDDGGKPLRRGNFDKELAKSRGRYTAPTKKAWKVCSCMLRMTWLTMYY